MILKVNGKIKFISPKLYCMYNSRTNYDKSDATLYKAIGTIHVSPNCIKYSVELKFY